MLDIVSVLDEVARALKLAQEAYAVVPDKPDIAAMQDSLRVALKHLIPARKLLVEVESQISESQEPLPSGWEDLQRQVVGLLRRSEAAVEAAGTDPSSEGLLRIQEVIARLGSDDTLVAVRDSLERRTQERIALIKQQAQTDIAAGDLVAALEKLSQVRQLDPNDQETTQLYVEMQQRRKLEEKLRQVQQEAAEQLSDNSSLDAMRTLRQGLDAFMEPDIPLSDQVWDIFNELTRLSDSDGGLALGSPENWQQAQELSAKLVRLRSENWVVALAIQIVDSWLGLARDNALQGVIASATQLGSLLEAYRSAVAYLKAHPTEDSAIQQLSEKQEALINKQNDLAIKRLQRAQDALEAGDFSVALHNLRDIERDFYFPIESEFPGLLDSYPEVQDVRDEVVNLQAVAQKLQGIYEEAQPKLESAYEAYRDNDWDTAEAALKNMPVNLGEIPELAGQVETLRKQIAAGRVNATRERLDGILGKIESGHQLVSTIEELDGYIYELTELVNPDALDFLNLQVLDVEYRNRYAQLLAELRERREALLARQMWEKELDELLMQERYSEAFPILDQIQNVTLDVEKHKALELLRHKIQREILKENERQTLLAEAYDCFALGKYVEAYQQFTKVKHLGADVDEMLDIAYAGVLFLDAKQLWEDSHDGTRALLYLDELQNIAIDTPQAKILREDVHNLQRAINQILKGESERKRQLSVIHSLIDSEELDTAMARLQELPDSPEIGDLRQQIQKYREAQNLLERAYIAYDEERYKDALQHIDVILSGLVPGYPKALALRGKIEVEFFAPQYQEEYSILTQEVQKLQMQWENSDEVISNATLERIDELVNQALNLPGYENDTSTGKLLAWVKQERSPFGQMRRFFVRAGFDVNVINSEIYRCISREFSYKKYLSKNTYVLISSDIELDHSHILEIYNKIQQLDECLDKEKKVVFVVTNRRPTNQGWAQIGILRMNNFIIIPLEQKVMLERLYDSHECQFMREELKKHLGDDYDPYDIRDPIAGVFSFFGREALTENLLRRINEGKPVGIFGLRKLGKSSLLKALCSDTSFPVAYIDLQLFGDATLNEIYSCILRSWQQWVHIRYDLDYELPELGTQNATSVFTSATLDLLACMASISGNSRLGVFFDEVETIVPRPDGSGPSLSRYLGLMRVLRGIVDRDGRLSLVVASLNPSINHINSWNGEQNPLFNRFQEIYLSPLHHDDCIQMIRNIGQQVGLVYSDVSAESIVELSGGHPFLARQFCSFLYKRRAYEPGKITEAIIPGAVNRFIYDDTTIVHLDQNIWKDAGNSALWGETQAQVNKSILLALARVNEPLSEDMLLKTQDSDHAYSALINLERFHFIYQPTPGYYALRYGLFHRWLRRRKLGLE